MLQHLPVQERHTLLFVCFLWAVAIRSGERKLCQTFRPKKSAHFLLFSRRLFFTIRSGLAHWLLSIVGIPRMFSRHFKHVEGYVTILHEWSGGRMFLWTFQVSGYIQTDVKSAKCKGLSYSVTLLSLFYFKMICSYVQVWNRFGYVVIWHTMLY